MRENHLMGQRISYMLGALGHDVYYAAINSYFAVYLAANMFQGSAHKDEMIALVTSLVLVIRLVEIVFDPIIGSIIDNTQTKNGKFKPWLIVGGIMSSIMVMVMFSGFGGLTTSSNTTLFTIVFIISFIILDAFYSFKDIALWSMIPALSAKNEERETLGTFARFGSAIGAQGTSILVFPIVYFFTAMMTGSYSEGSSGWFIFGVIVAIVQGGTALIAAFGTKEQDSSLRQKAEKTKFVDVFKALVTNDQLMWLSLAYILFALAYGAVNGTLPLLFTFVLGNQLLFSAVGWIGFIGSILLVPLFPKLSQSFGRRRVFTGAIISMLIGLLLFFFGNSEITVILGVIFMTCPYQLVFLSVLMTITDSVEYGQWKNGVRSESVTLAMRPLLDKVAGAFQNGIYSFVAISAGMTGAKYIAGANYHVGMFKIYVYAIPAILIIISLVLFLTKVKLTEQRHREIVADLEKRLG
ncbi:galactose/methyl-galactoside ABC transporter permease protein [Weissella oryzae SG25]|uniref:Galactose/methyl-galactoside ABC transporter permease protein n=2 Tax=Weissella TaxID=46255 RepID=A0A069D2T3_WEIOS|nr:galactose/methyl-galactoside ABC transporter permease protein [Weissella oryzae SG25]